MTTKHSKMSLKRIFLVLFWSLNLFLGCCIAKFSEVHLKDDSRSIIHLVSYGMFESGELNVSLSLVFTGTSSQTDMDNISHKFGFTLDKTHQSSAQIAQYEEKTTDGKACDSITRDSSNVDSKSVLVRFQHDNGGQLELVRGNETQTVEIHSLFSPTSQQTERNVTADPLNLVKREVESDDEPTGVEPTAEQEPERPGIRYTRTEVNGEPVKGRSDLRSYKITLGFRVSVLQKTDAGLYSLYFHNCDGSNPPSAVIVSLDGTIVGQNRKPLSYLSAGDIPLPFLYFTVCIVYMLLAFVWMRVLRAASSGVFKTHYLMLAVCICKSFSALFHGMNYYYIGKNGREETAWAIIYYITYLMKTVMLFLTIMLVGSGWTFIKHVFSEKEKKLFLIAIPLQVLLYVGYVIMSETDVASKTYSTWSTLSVIIDLLCCGAILAPVMWSIRHLEEASQTDGKTSINLLKLKLFKSMYMMLVAYVYTTRLIILVMKLTLPFSSSYLGEVFTEVTVLLFLVTLGYKFRPADDNPYFHIPPDWDDEQDDEVEVVVAQSSVHSDAKKRRKTTEGGENEGLLSHQESSHDLD